MAVVLLDKIVDHGNIGMQELGQDAGFLSEPFQELCLVDQRGV